MGDYPRPGAAEPENGRKRAHGKVTHAHRSRRNGHPGLVVWLTGPAGGGKSAIAAALERELFDAGRQAYVLDADHVRGGLCSDLAFSPHDLRENARRVGETAKLFADAGVVCIVALISPSRAERALARGLLPSGRFVEVYVHGTPAGHPENRSTGLREDTPCEPPQHPEVELDTDRLTVAQSVMRILDALNLRGSEADFSI